MMDRDLIEAEALRVRHAEQASKAAELRSRQATEDWAMAQARCRDGTASPFVRLRRILLRSRRCRGVVEVKRTGIDAHDRGPYQLFMLVLCGMALLVLGTGAFVQWSESTRTILNYADNVVCGLFLIDFMVTLRRAPDKKHYLLTWGWIDLLSSIPMIDALRWGRVARALRILRVLRGVKSARALTHFMLGKRTESAVLVSVLVALVVVVASSISVLEC